MFTTLVRWQLKILLQGTLWVFILAIPYNNRTIFDHAYDVLVENSVVEMLDREGSRLWRQFKSSAQATYARARAGERPASG